MGSREQGNRMKTIRSANVGKATIRLVEDNHSYSGLVIRDGKIVETLSGTEPDKVWEALHRAVATTAPSFFGYDGARARFLRMFPDGCHTPAFIQSEREYKFAAKKKLESTAPLDRALNETGLAESVLSVFRATNLLSPFEKTRITDALRGKNGDRFVHGAALFASGELKAGLHEMKAALDLHDVAKWTAVTYLPFLWRPDVHMFLKPEVTKDFSERVGHPYAEIYRPTLDIEVYESLLDLVATTKSEISDLNPADHIDIQSFIWVVGAYDAEDEKSLLTKQ